MRLLTYGRINISRLVGTWNSRAVRSLAVRDPPTLPPSDRVFRTFAGRCGSHAYRSPPTQWLFAARHVVAPESAPREPAGDARKASGDFGFADVRAVAFPDFRQRGRLRLPAGPAASRTRA